MEEKATLSINDPLFAIFRTELDVYISDTLDKMYKDHRSEGNVTAKIGIQLPGNDEALEVLTPKITYRIETNIPYKMKREGKIHEDVMVYRDSDGIWRYFSKQVTMDEIIEDQRGETDWHE